MEAIIAIAACALLIVQAHRNYLMVQAAKRASVAPEIIVNVPAPVVNVTVEAPEPVELTAVEAFEFDYSYLEVILDRITSVLESLERPIPPITRQDVTIPLRTLPEPTWQAPTISEINVEEINGIEVRRFPAR